MHRPVAAFALTLAASAMAPAQGNPDLMKTPECIAARQQLEEVLAAGGPRSRLNAVRDQAAVRCLGVKAPPLPENRFVPPPVAVDPIRLRSEPDLRPRIAAPGPGLTPPAPPVTAPAPPVAIPRPTVITTCDAAGCWDSNGMRHNQQGPVLVGPRGVCTVQGGLLNCP